ncbi:unnamed protein product [Dibothriocephalus latus]|uniref:Uncharacterized protein n=1 Tax=Dibothriocephalus latus TaxID=60516 RepID=A0A3P7PIQ2_DIBLA|nr:unnamed protein product [Dibothriocephalus latus]
MAANTGQPICKAGIHDCVDSPNGSFCRSEQIAVKAPGLTADECK